VPKLATSGAAAFPRQVERLIREGVEMSCEGKGSTKGGEGERERQREMNQIIST